MKNLLIMRYLMFLMIILPLFVFGCKEEDDSRNEPLPCEDEHSEKIIEKWHRPIYDSGLENCVDTLCIEFELVLHEDSTYYMNYLLFHSFTDPLEVHTLVDTGRYNFICDNRGSYTTRFIYSFVEGFLELNSFTEPDRNLEIRIDGFWGLIINPKDLGLFNSRLLLQKEE